MNIDIHRVVKIEINEITKVGTENSPTVYRTITITDNTNNSYEITLYAPKGDESCIKVQL